MKVAERKSSRPEGWLSAGAKVPIRLTVKQEAYCRRAQGVRRFCYNLAVATHRFHRSNRIPWPSWQDIYKAFNACKAEDYPFVTEVASRVAEGAFMDFGRAITNWRNPEVKAHAPTFIKRKATGEGSFRAASGVTQIRYNSKRRVTLPLIGSIKLACTLPKGIYHEAHIRKQNGRWYLCLKLWQEPHPAPAPDTRTAGGGRYRHQPQCHRFRRPSVPEPQGLLRYGTEAQTLATCPGAQDQRLPGLVGSPAADRPVPPPHTRNQAQRYPPDDQHPDQEVQRPGHRGPERSRHDGGAHTQGPGRRQHGRNT